MGGISVDARHEPRTNPSWRNLPREQAPGWGMNGPGVSAEWSQGGESEWNSVAASADETRAALTQEIEVPRDGEYRLWARYADWAGKAENFVVRVTQNGRRARYYELTATGRKQLGLEQASWQRASAAIDWVMNARLAFDGDRS